MRLENAEIMERPIALQTSLIANQNRDPKKKREPFKWEDFAMYTSKQNEAQADGRYGAAMMQLIKQKRLPSWALFCYKELAGSADQEYIPTEPGFVAKDAILLHPVKQNGGYTGLLIAMESCSDQTRIFIDSKGNQIALEVPFIETKLVAREDQFLSQ